MTKLLLGIKLWKTPTDQAIKDVKLLDCHNQQCFQPSLWNQHLALQVFFEFFFYSCLSCKTLRNDMYICATGFLKMKHGRHSENSTQWYTRHNLDKAWLLLQILSSFCNKTYFALCRPSCKGIGLKDIASGTVLMRGWWWIQRDGIQPPLRPLPGIKQVIFQKF